MLEVIDERSTGETILDEALKMMKLQEATGEKMAINTWIDLLSGASISQTPIIDESNTQNRISSLFLQQLKVKHGTS